MFFCSLVYFFIVSIMYVLIQSLAEIRNKPLPSGNVLTCFGCRSLFIRNRCGIEVARKCGNFVLVFDCYVGGCFRIAVFTVSFYFGVTQCHSG